MIVCFYWFIIFLQIKRSYVYYISTIMYKYMCVFMCVHDKVEEIKQEQLKARERGEEDKSKIWKWDWE